jgi:hypothetical protein
MRYFHGKHWLLGSSTIRNWLSSRFPLSFVVVLVGVHGVALFVEQITVFQATALSLVGAVAAASIPLAVRFKVLKMASGTWHIALPLSLSIAFFGIAYYLAPVLPTNSPRGTYLRLHSMEAIFDQNYPFPWAHSTISASFLIKTTIGITATYGLFWIGLITVYPYSRIVQALFWSPYAYRARGLVLSHLAILFPAVTHRLLAPFRNVLAPRNLTGTDDVRFLDIDVTVGTGADRIPLTQALPSIRGVTVLEGISGSGKTTYMNLLAAHSQKVVVVVEANQLTGDVLNTIAERLTGGEPTHVDFIYNAIRSGQLSVCIDGLNEAAPDARSAIMRFVSLFAVAPKANILVTRQPGYWDFPQKVRHLRLQPLQPRQWTAFLEYFANRLPDIALLSGERFRERMRGFVREMQTTTAANLNERVARASALSNLMDLTMIGLVLANGIKPNLLNIQETTYLLAAAYYGDQTGGEFPLLAFSEHVYEQTFVEFNKVTLNDQRFLAEYGALEHYKLLLKSIDEHGGSVWHFRHDKVLDFFLYVAFTGRGNNERILTHFDDFRFRGVYLLLAERASLEVATMIRDELFARASGRFYSPLEEEMTQVVRAREAA